jgi:amino acid adenylation domain-containing protein
MAPVIDTYELSPMQAGMLFHAIDGGDPGVYIEQVVATLHEPLDEEQFLRAWQRVADRHPILRSRFRWEEVAEPVQDLVDRVQIPVERFDWCALAEAECHQRFQALVEHERIRGFDLEEAPLMRLVLVRVAESKSWVLWTFHHILLDGWSGVLLLQEVFAFYEAFSRGEDVDLPLPRPYRDYIEWLRKLDYDSAKAYWQGLLSGFCAPTPLIVARDRDAKQVAGRVWGTHEMRLSVALTTALRKRARVASVTLSMLLQGAWALLLHGYSGESDVVFGVTRACRGSALDGVGGIVGLLINTLPIRVSIDPESELVTWLRRLRAQQAALCDYEHTPLVKIQGWSDLPRGMPLFESILVFDNQTLDSQLRALGGAWSERRFLGLGQTNYPLTVIAYGDDELLLQIQYSRQRFDDVVVARMLGHLQTLLEGIAAQPRARLRDLALLTEAERHQLLEVWNRTSVAYSSARCVHEMFEEQTRIRPGALAAESGGRRLTYRALNERADGLARQLRMHGVRSNSLVAIYLERSIEMLVGILGVWKAGGAYVPIDPDYPAERVRFMLQDTKAVVVLTHKDLSGALASSGATILHLDAAQASVTEYPDPRAECSPQAPDQLAYVIYTSGSTGRPKGVPITHENLFNLICWHQRTYEVTPADRATQIAGPAFDASVWEVWPYLTAGASVHIPDDATRLDAKSLIRWLADRKITLSFLPTPLAECVLLERWPQGAALRVLLTGGDKLTKWPAQKLPFRVVNHYGPTENTVVSTCTEVIVQGDSNAAPPIGRPLPNTQAFVLDRYLRPVPIGVPGELLVGGVQLTSRYWNQPELTAEQFISDPFHPDSGALLYKTGDLVRFLADGNIEFLGRIDNQVKIRGFRIELGEIEAVIARHPFVRQVAVIAREDTEEDKRLVAYLVVDQSPADLVDQLRTRVRSAMPAYMVPVQFVTLDALPLTRNGKVDRDALPVPSVRDLTPRKGATAPRTATEQMVIGAFCDVLDRADFGVFDSFFDLGGHSLMAARLMSKIRAASGIDLPIRNLFERPTAAGLAEAIDALAWAASSRHQPSATSNREEIEL